MVRERQGVTDQGWYRAVRTLLGLMLRRPIIGVCVIPILPDDTVVLMRRRDTGLWGLPGGLMDWGEDVATSAQRELREETSLAMEKVGRLVGVYSSPHRDRRFHSVCITIEVFVQGIPQVNDPTEAIAVQNFRWQDLEGLPMSHDHTQHLKDYLDGRVVVD